jgi:hypothetical protein
MTEFAWWKVRARLSGLVRSTLGGEMKPCPVHLDRQRLARFVYFNSLLEQVSEVEGDLVECGVADGESLAAFAALARLHKQRQVIWGFDSWTGLPQPTTQDFSVSGGIAAKGMFRYSSTDRVRQELISHGLSPEEVDESVRLVPGMFSQTLRSFSRPIALLHIDADLYASYVDCLSHLWHHVAEGGIIAFDEYDQPAIWPGARRAVDEFIASLKGEQLEMFESPISGKWWGVKKTVSPSSQART